MLYRIPLRANFSVRHWENDNLQEYDKASVGSSALLAALKRNVIAEIAYWLGYRFATILNDFEKYFDTLDLKVLMTEGILTKFPLGPMAYALQQHMAPRVLQANGCTSKPTKVNKSILAGCKLSVPFTRVYALRRFIKLVEDHKKANPELFVDDTSLHATAETYKEVEDILVNAMKQFQTLVNELNLRLSPKAAIVTSCQKLSVRLNAKLAKYGLKFVVAKHSRDLGITTTAGKSRPKQIHKQRLTKSFNRVSKTSKISKISRSARKLYQGSGYAVSSWGHQACAVSESDVRSMESDALALSLIHI